MKKMIRRIINDFDSSQILHGSITYPLKFRTYNLRVTIYNLKAVQNVLPIIQQYLVNAFCNWLIVDRWPSCHRQEIIFIMKCNVQTCGLKVQFSSYLLQVDLHCLYLTIVCIFIRRSKHTVKLCVHEVLVHLLCQLTCFGSVKRKYNNKLML